MVAAIYTRVSSAGQDVASQLPDLERWAGSQAEAVRWFTDKATGTKMARPGLDELIAEARAGKVSSLTVWRLDRLGRSATGLLALLDELQRLGVGFISLRDGIDMGTPIGRLVLVVLAGVAQFETEIRRERQAAGIAAAKAAGKQWGGRKAGIRVRLTTDKEEAILSMRREGKTVASICRAVELSADTVYRVLKARV